MKRTILILAITLTSLAHIDAAGTANASFKKCGSLIDSACPFKVHVEKWIAKEGTMFSIIDACGTRTYSDEFGSPIKCAAEYIGKRAAE